METLNFNNTEPESKFFNNNSSIKRCTECPYEYKIEQKRNNSKHCCNTINYILNKESTNMHFKEKNNLTSKKDTVDNFINITLNLINEFTALKLKLDSYYNSNQKVNKEENGDSTNISNDFETCKQIEEILSENLQFEPKETFTFDENIYSLLNFDSETTIIGLAEGTVISFTNNNSNFKQSKYKEHTDKVWSLKNLSIYDKSQKTFISGSSDSLIKIWKLNNKNSILTLNTLPINNYETISTSVYCLETCENYNKNMLISAQDNGNLTLWNIRESSFDKVYEEKIGVNKDDYVKFICYDKMNFKSSFIFISLSEGDLILFDLNHQKIKLKYFTFVKEAFISEVFQYSKDMFIARSSDNRIIFYSIYSQKPYKILDIQSIIYSICLNSNLLFITLSSKKIIIVNTNNQKIINEINFDTKLFKFFLQIRKAEKAKINNEHFNILDYSFEIIGISGRKLNFYKLKNNNKNYI